MPKNYVPKYSLSIAILRSFMTQNEFKDLIQCYVVAKKEGWKPKLKK